MKRAANRYGQIIEWIFESRYRKGARQLPFRREEIQKAAACLRIQVPKNIGDLIYSFRHRTALPESIRKRAPEGYEWVIVQARRSQYRFELRKTVKIAPNENLTITKVPDATPGIIAMYALNDEQALLAKLRYNRLLDIFTRVTCYSLQSHLRTAVPELGQVETDEIYVGLDRRGAHYVFPVQAKGARERLSAVQIEQDLAVCRRKFPKLICRPIGAQFMARETIALFEFEESKCGVLISLEQHYQLAPPEELTDEELEKYRRRPVEQQ